MDLTDGELSLESINLYGATDLTGQRRYKGGGEEDVYYLKDHLGNIRTILKDEKNNPAFSNKIRAEQFSLLSARDYFPFGSTMRSSNFGVKADLDKWRYQGKERDQETGYDYFEARYFDGDLGRFMQVDPLAEKFVNMNSYTGMNNNPVSLIDPTGMSAELGCCDDIEPTFIQQVKQENQLEQAYSSVVVNYGSNAKKSSVSSFTQGVIKDALVSSGNPNVTVTSTARTPKDQARAMFNNIERKGVSSQKKLYGAAGDKVIDVYSKNTADVPVSLTNTSFPLGSISVKTSSDKSIKQQMTNKINEIGPSKVSRHLADPSKSNVVDLAPSSLSNPNRFINTLKSDPRVSKTLTPPTDPAIHIVVPQKKN